MTNPIEVVDAARRLDERHGTEMAERRAVDFAGWYPRSHPRRDFWMRVAQVLADFRAEVQP